MTSIAKQSTIEALTIYHKAQKKEWGVRVVDGNVRIASWTEHLGSRIKNYFNPSRERTNWNEKAELAIQHKLFGEVSLFQEKIEVKSVTSLLKNIFLLDIKKSEPNFKSTLENSNLLKNNKDIKQLWEIKDKKIYDLVVEELIHAKDQDLTKATEVAQYTLNLIKKFGLSKDTALNAARNIYFAMDEFKIESEKAFELVQARGKLINKGHLKDDLPLKLQLSAALAFTQLLDKGKDEKEALGTVNNRIDTLKKIQSRIPEEMKKVVDCVHEGKNYEYKISFSKEQKEQIAEQLKTQLKDPLYNKNKAIEDSIKDLSKIHFMKTLGKQCITDGPRSTYCLEMNGKDTNTLNIDLPSNQTKTVEVTSENAITNPDLNIRDIPESNLEKNFLKPLEKFQKISQLNNKNITDISLFLSQTSLGTLLNFSLEVLNSSIQSNADPDKERLIFNLNLMKNQKEEKGNRIILSATHYSEATNLVISQASDKNTPTSFTTLPINQLLKVSEKAGPEKYMQKTSIKYEIRINENDEINMTVLDAEIVYKFNIDEATLDKKHVKEIFS